MKVAFILPAALGLAVIIAGCSKPQPNITVSVTFGKAWAYSPHSNEVMDWSGSLTIGEGSLDSLFKLSYGITNWEKGYGGCSREYQRKLSGTSWNTDIKPGSGRGLEGIRFFLKGDAGTTVTLDLKAGKVEFSLGDLLREEFLEFRFGGYYSYQPVSVYLGPDARPRITKKAWAAKLEREKRLGSLLVPEDFSGPKVNFMSAWCTVIAPGQSVEASLANETYNPALVREVPFRLQLMAGLPAGAGGYETATGWITFGVRVGDYETTLKHFFTSFRQAEKLFDLYVNVPAEVLEKEGRTIRLTHLEGAPALMLHRVFVNQGPEGEAGRLATLPPLPGKPGFWVGYDLNTTTTQNGEVDSVIIRMNRERLGNYVLFRIEENSTCNAGDIRRWGNLAAGFGFRAGTTMGRDVADILAETMGAGFVGIHRHEASNLIYGWGDAEPLAKRKDRTLADCEAAYARRMKDVAMLGQALPMCNLDYRSGVGFISSEFPTGHSTLMMASNRGGSYLYEKPYWGVHLANHVMRMPDDETTLRRNFIFLWQSWLYGARLVYDEESALYGIHSTSYSWSDPMTRIRRQQMQDLYHYGSVIEPGAEEVKTGFLIGKYDCLVGGVQSSPEMEPTKVWGMFGPETESWKFDTPESGWRLLESYMPGVWLYPVRQDPGSINLFTGGSPNGQVDLVTVDGDLAKLLKYDLLILPGWNTMTPEVYEKLIGYVTGGGHLVLAAAQCTNHATRDFLLEKSAFDFYNGGDLTGLCGLRVDSVTAPLPSIRWKDGRKAMTAGLPGLRAVLSPGAVVLAESESGQPLLVENSVGQGRVWTLVAGEYWGAPALEDFRKQLCDTLALIHRGKTYITGDTRDVDFHVYTLPDSTRRAVFLNTDWTQPLNTKEIVFHDETRQMPLTVSEGSLTQCILHPGLSFSHRIPGALSKIVSIGRNQATLSLSGTGKQVFSLFPPDSVRISIPGNPGCDLSGNNLSVDFGPGWKEMIVQLRFVN